MEKTRVKKGEKYYWLGCLLEVNFSIEYYDDISDALYCYGNYFCTQEEAESMANKLRAVLKGADVIEMPSDIEIKYLYPPQITNDEDAEFHEGMRVGVSNTIDVFKDKIVK